MHRTRNAATGFPLVRGFESPSFRHSFLISFIYSLFQIAPAQSASQLTFHALRALHIILSGTALTFNVPEKNGCLIALKEDVSSFNSRIL